MKFLLASILIASLAAAPAAAQSPAQPGAKPAAQTAKAAKTSKAAPAKKARAAKRRQAIEVATPTEEPDPSIKLGEAELAIAKRVFVGEIQCELGAKVTVRPMKRDGFFLVARGVNRFVMHPVASRTGAIRLEDPARGALWLQIGNKSMLMNQKEGKRLADECQSPEQLKFAADMKTRPPVNLLEPTAAAVASPAAPLTPTPASAPAPAQ